MRKNSICGMVVSLTAAIVAEAAPLIWLNLAGSFALKAIFWIALPGLVVSIIMFFKTVNKEAPPPIPSISPVFQNNPVTSPIISPTISPEIKVQVSAVPTLDKGPQITFARRGNLGTPKDSWQNGFYLRNHGDGAALAVTVQRIQIIGGVFASSKVVPTIGKDETASAPVWLEGYSPFGFDTAKWDLLAAMRQASDATNVGMYRPDHVVRIVAICKDFYGQSYESNADLSYVPARGELVFGPTTWRKLS